MRRIILLLIAILPAVNSFGQDYYISPAYRSKLDSLDKKIQKLSAYIRNNSSNRNAQYFSIKRELGLTKFVKEYESLLYREEFDEAFKLIESRILAAKKSRDEYSINYFNNYNSKLTATRISRQNHYQKLFLKEKNFQKHYKSYIEEIDSNSLFRAQYMIDLAIQYAHKNGRTETLAYLDYLREYNQALFIDLASTYNLELLTNNLSKFDKMFDEMLSSDSIHILQEANALLADCENYSRLARSEVQPGYFSMQQNITASTIAKWNITFGQNADISSLTDAVIIARFDELNEEGIFIWNQHVIVIGSVNFSSNSELVRRGQAISEADRKLFQFIKLNRIVKFKPNDQKTAGTFILPYNNNGKKQYYKFNESTDNFQYMVCYRSIINEKVTKDLGKFLQPLQFLE